MKEKYLEDLKDIKDIMNRSSRFISLSGLSGIFAGIFALIGAYLAYQIVYTDHDYSTYRKVIVDTKSVTVLLTIAIIILLFSVGTSILLTTRKALKNNQKPWDFQTQRLLINFAIPLVTGGILCLILLFKGYVGLTAPLTLIFYGLALVNASKYTLNEIRGLGILEVILGLLGAYFIGFGLVFWAIGFGILHIVYGIIMQIKYGS